MKSSPLFMLTVCLLFAANVFSADRGLTRARNYEWANDPRLLAPSTRGLNELPRGNPKSKNTTGFGELIGEWTWAEIGIPSGYAGAGISINYPYLYLCNQSNSRIYIVDVSTGIPESVLVWFNLQIDYWPWGAGMDNEPELWMVCYPSHMCHEYSSYPPIPSPTGNNFHAHQGYAWMADISDNVPYDTLYIVRVGGNNHIYAFPEPRAWDVRTQGYWRRQCEYRPHEDICVYVDSVRVLAELFHGFDCDSICDLMSVDPPEHDMCGKARRQFMALLLNVASGKLAVCSCLENGREVGDVIDEVDSLLSGPRDRAACERAKTLADNINNGIGIVYCGAERNFGHPDWDYISQRALAYNNDEGTLFIGGWNSDRIWEINMIDGAPLPGRSFMCPNAAGAAYQDTAHGDPCLWVQLNEFHDRLMKYHVPTISQQASHSAGHETVRPVSYLDTRSPSINTALIRYELSISGPVRLKIYDRIGRLVRVLVDAEQGPGSHRIDWNGLDRAGCRVPNGIYFTRLEAGSSVRTGSLILLR